MKVSTAKRGLFEIRDEWLTRPLDEDHVAVLRAVLNEGGELPPLSVVKIESGALAVVDGNHRFGAYSAERPNAIPYRVVGKGEATITWWLAAANRDHGKNRTDTEKRTAVQRAIDAPEGADMSNADLARHCGVSVDLVRKVREAVRGAPSAAAERRQIAEAAASSDASNRGAARASGTNKDAVRRARQVAQSQVTHDCATPDAGPEPLPFEPEAAPEWRGMADACDRVAASLVAVKREHSAALKTIPGGQEIVDLLTRAHGIASRRKPQACPVPKCAGASCAVCGGKGYTLGRVDGWEKIVAAAARRTA